jgi:hypothetical protein
MDLDRLANLGEFVGGVFVLITLVYLAYQLRQNTKSLRTENYARVLERMSTLQSRLAAEPELNHLFMVGAEDPGRLTGMERTRFAWALYEMFGAAEFMYHQSLEKALPPAVWSRWEASIRWWLSHPGIRTWWAAKPAPFAADFETFASEMMRKDPMDAVTLDRWRRFVAGDGLPAPLARAAATPPPVGPQGVA